MEDRLHASAMSRGRVVTLVVAAVSCLLSCVAADVLDHCGNEQLTVRLRLGSLRNETGHWITDVHVDRGDQLVTTGHRDLMVEATQNAVICNCSTDVLIIQMTITVPPPLPGPAYTLVPALGYYRVVPSPVPLHRALLACERDHAHLLVVDSDQEAAAVTSLLHGFPMDKRFYANFQGWPLATYGRPCLPVLVSPSSSPAIPTTIDRMLWCTGHGARTGDMHCSSIGTDGGQHMVPCHSQLAFVCEQEWWE